MQAISTPVMASGTIRADSTPVTSPEKQLIAPKKVFVAGATGNTGKRIVNQLLQKGIKVRAGVRNLEKAREAFPFSDNLEFVEADVTKGAESLKDVLGDAEAAICATGFSPGWDPTTAWRVDNYGTVALVDACLSKGITRFVLVSSILTNGAAWGQALNPSYLILNLFGLVLIAKLQAERYIQRSGINYTIVRPGGLKSDPPSGSIVMSAEDTLSGGSISRDSVAKVAVESLFYPEAHYKIAEIIEEPDAKSKGWQELFSSLTL